MQLGKEVWRTVKTEHPGRGSVKQSASLPCPPPKCLTLSPFFRTAHSSEVQFRTLVFLFVIIFCLKREHKEDPNSSRVNKTACRNAFVFEVRLNLSSSKISAPARSPSPFFPGIHPPALHPIPSTLRTLSVFKEQNLHSSFHEIVKDWEKTFKTPRNEFLRI